MTVYREFLTFLTVYREIQTFLTVYIWKHSREVAHDLIILKLPLRILYVLLCFSPSLFFSLSPSLYVYLSLFLSSFMYLFLLFSFNQAPCIVFLSFFHFIFLSFSFYNSKLSGEKKDILYICKILNIF